MTNKEIMECIIMATLLVGNITAAILLFKMVFRDFVHVLRGEAY